MKCLLSLIVVCFLLTTGCTSLNRETMKFKTAADIHFSVNQSNFDSIELQPSETLIWHASELVGIITVVERDPQFETSVEEVKFGFNENLKVSETTQRLNLPSGAFGFSSSIRDFTTAFVASDKNEEFWLTVSARNDYFDEILSSVSFDQ